MSLTCNLSTEDGFSITSSLSIPSSPNSGMSAPRVHPRYHLNDELTVFLVNNEVLFKVHRHFFDRESEKFRSLPTGTDENPVHLDDVQEDEFEALLDYFYDRVHGAIPRSLEEWMRLLSISQQFGMEKIHNRAIKELNPMGLDPVDRIVLAVNHDIPAWLNPAYVKLCVRKEALREDEAHKLGLSTTVKLAYARERLRETEPQQVHEPISWGSRKGFQHDDFSPAPSTSTDDVKLAESIIAEVFNLVAPIPHDDASETEAVAAVPSHQAGAKKKGKK